MRPFEREMNKPRILSSPVHVIIQQQQYDVLIIRMIEKEKDPHSK